MREDVTLRRSLMTHGFNEQRQKDLLALDSEAQQRGNVGYYLPARIELEIRDTNERAQALYDACCEVWEIHGLKRNRVFYRAVFENCLQFVFGTRRAVVASELHHRYASCRIPEIAAPLKEAL
jgi:ribosomal protein S18 acetylase RimI-like enzyme